MLKKRALCKSAYIKLSALPLFFTQLYEMLKNHIDIPISINCDFEKAIHKAAKKSFSSNLDKYGNFAHLCQDRLGLTKLYSTNKDSLLVFKLFQSLAYCKVEDVIVEFILNSDIYCRLNDGLKDIH